MNKLISFIFITSLFIISPVMAVWQNTSIFCIDNSTLLENVSISKDGNYSFLNMTKSCFNGCDNVTFSCSPPPFVSDLLSFIIIAVFFAIGIYIAYKVIK